MNNKKVILLFGMPRSGTTWIGKIFDSHINTLYRHEPDTWLKISEIPFLENVNNFELYCHFVNQYVEKLIDNRSPQVNGKMPLFSKNYASYLRNIFFKLSVYFSSAVNKVNNNIFLPVISPINEDKVNDVVIVWKSIQLLGRLGVIAKCIDNCTVVHIMRHPCGYISSVLNGEKNRKFMSGTSASEDYGLYEKLLDIPQAKAYGLTLEGLRKLEPIERLAWRWVLFNEKSVDDLDGFSKVKILRYEDACIKPLETFKDLFDYCELSWCEQTKDFILSSTTQNKDAYYSVYKDPEVAAFKWRENMSKKDINLVKNVVSRSRMSGHYQDMF